MPFSTPIEVAKVNYGNDSSYVLKPGNREKTKNTHSHTYTHTHTHTHMHTYIVRYAHSSWTICTFVFLQYGFSFVVIVELLVKDFVKGSTEFYTLIV